MITPVPPEGLWLINLLQTIASEKTFLATDKNHYNTHGCYKYDEFFSYRVQKFTIVEEHPCISITAFYEPKAFL